MMKFNLIPFVVLSALLVGCAKPPEAQATPSEGKPDAVTSNAPVRHSPDASAEGGGYRITPPNPNDPKFKADPKLAGGN